MFGPSIFSVFRSRWKALFWALGVLITVWSIVPSAEQSKNASPGDGASDAAQAATAVRDASRALEQSSPDNTE